MANLGRDKIWADNPQLWADIDAAVKEEVGRIRVLQKVFIGVPAEGSEVQDPQIVNQNPLMMAEALTLPLVEIASTFALTQTQVDQEAKLRTARQLARRAARYLAVDEDRLFFVGGQQNEEQRRKAQRRNGQGVAPLNRMGKALDEQQTTLFDGVVQAIARLADLDHPGPYALFVGTQVYAEAHSPLPNTLITEADRIRPLVESGFLTSSTLGEQEAILVSLGGETVSMHLGTDATTQFLQWDGDGNAQFRVFERLRLVVREPDAVVPFQVAARQEEQQSQQIVAPVQQQAPPRGRPQPTLAPAEQGATQKTTKGS